MVACIAGMLLDEFDEFLPPGVIGVGKQLFSKRFQVVTAYHFDVLLDRLASILVDLLDIKVLGFHAGRLLPGLSDRPAKSACALKRSRRKTHLDAGALATPQVAKSPRQTIMPA
jgi:hypothetical protein